MRHVIRLFLRSSITPRRRAVDRRCQGRSLTASKRSAARRAKQETLRRERWQAPPSPVAGQRRARGIVGLQPPVPRRRNSATQRLLLPARFIAHWRRRSTRRFRHDDVHYRDRHVRRRRQRRAVGARHKPWARRAATSGRQRARYVLWISGFARWCRTARFSGTMLGRGTAGRSQPSLLGAVRRGGLVSVIDCRAGTVQRSSNGDGAGS